MGIALVFNLLNRESNDSSRYRVLLSLRKEKPEVTEYFRLRCLKEILKAEPNYAFDICIKIATTSKEFQKSVQGPNSFILFIGGTRSDLNYY